MIHPIGTVKIVYSNIRSFITGTVNLVETEYTGYVEVLGGNYVALSPEQIDGQLTEENRVVIYGTPFRLIQYHFHDEQYLAKLETNDAIE